MCEFSSAMGNCSYLLAALMELKSLDFHPISPGRLLQKSTAPLVWEKLF